jgi:hypothetical protein
VTSAVTPTLFKPIHGIGSATACQHTFEQPQP